MLKINFNLKKSDTDQGSLEYITIDSPRVNEAKEFGWNSYVCNIYFSEMKKPHPPIYGTNPIDPLLLALEIVKIYLQGYINRGYIISEVENGEIWKLGDKKDPILAFQEHISKLKNNPDIPPEIKQKILGIMKETFGKLPFMKDLINKAIDEN